MSDSLLPRGIKPGATITPEAEALRTELGVSFAGAFFADQLRVASKIEFAGERLGMPDMGMGARSLREIMEYIANLEQAVADAREAA